MGLMRLHNKKPTTSIPTNCKFTSKKGMDGMPYVRKQVTRAKICDGMDLKLF